MDESSLLKKILFNKGYVISVEHVYREICKSCDFPAPSFDILNKNILKYKATYIKFSNFIINHPENKLFDKYTFQNYNININIPRRKRICSLNNKIVNIPKRNRLSPQKNVDVFEQKSITISTIINNNSSKNIPSNNNKNSDKLELKSNTIPPINNNKSSKNDRSNINNNVDIPEQNSTINNIKVDIPEQNSLTILTKNNSTINNNDVEISEQYSIIKHNNNNNVEIPEKNSITILTKNNPTINNNVVDISEQHSTTIH